MKHRTDLPNGRWISAEITGEGPVVLLLHGIPGRGAVWRAVSGRLAARHRVILPDLIGFGDSARTDAVEALWADAQAAAVGALLDDLAIEDVLLVGHDFGGPVAAHLLGAGRGRFVGLMLIAANTFGDTPIPFPLSGVTWPIVGSAWGRLLFSAPSLRKMVRMGVGKDGPDLDTSLYVGDREQASAIAAIFATALRNLAPRYGPITEILGGVHIPARVVWGDRDPFFPLAQGTRTARLIDGADLLTLPGAGHFLPEECPDEIAEAIADFATNVR